MTTGVEWPPLASVGWPGIAFLAGPVLWLLSALVVFATDFGVYLAAVYLAWMLLDRRSPVDGRRRRWRWLRGLGWWQRHRDYFPIRLVKTAELPPDKNYLFAVFPHGIFTLGAFTAFMTEALDFEERFPGLTLSFCTLNIVFRLPFMRELALGIGMRSVSEESLDRILSRKRTGQAAAIAVGGAAEAFLSKPDTYNIFMANRKGFCRVALRNGSDIVPVYSFGESDVFDVHEAREGSRLDRLQKWVKKLTTVGPVVFTGHGPLRVFPKKAPITVTVGKPIPVTRVERPTRDDVDELHRVVADSLAELFDEHKQRFLGRENIKLNIF